MTRVSIHIDETNPANPKPVLVVNGQELAMDDRELDDIWAKDQISTARKTYYTNLTRKYK
jgi:hypothetical protein